MKLLHRVTWDEWFTILCVAIFVGGTLLPDSATQTRWRLERRARDFKKTITPKLHDKSIIATDAAIAGAWICRHRLDRSSFVFTGRPDGQFDADFSTSGCLGGCTLKRTARFDGGVIRLDSAVAEYVPRTYDTIYAVCIQGTEYLLPAERLSDFEQELGTGTRGWERYVFRRDNGAKEASDSQRLWHISRHHHAPSLLPILRINIAVSASPT